MWTVYIAYHSTAAIGMFAFLSYWWVVKRSGHLSTVRDLLGLLLIDAFMVLILAALTLEVPILWPKQLAAPRRGQPLMAVIKSACGISLATWLIAVTAVIVVWTYLSDSEVLGFGITAALHAAGCLVAFATCSSRE